MDCEAFASGPGRASAPWMGAIGVRGRRRTTKHLQRLRFSPSGKVRKGKSRARASAFWTRYVTGARRTGGTGVRELPDAPTAPIPILRELTSGQRLRSRPDSDSPDYAAALGLAGHVLSLEGGHLRATMVPGESGERVPAE